MFLKKILLGAYIFSFSSILAYELTDPIAYKSGELVAELTVEAWIQAAVGRKDEVIKLAKKIAAIGQDYVLSMSFIRGNFVCLQKKDMALHMQDAQLTRFGCALVLACYYYWIFLLQHMIRLSDFNFSENSYYEDQALMRATIEMYGEPLPEVIAELKNMLENDQLGLSQMWTLYV